MRAPDIAEMTLRVSGRARIAETPLGPVEHAEAGDGPALLSLHPAMGGWDTGLGMAAAFWSNGWRVIAPSRPGYLGTPEGAGGDPASQADRMAALLDALAIDSCAVVGHCAGGIVGYELAARHPDRVRSLVLISTPTAPDIGVSPGVLRIAMTRPMLAMLMRRDRALLGSSVEDAARRMIGDDSTLGETVVERLARRVAADPSRAAYVTSVWGRRTVRSAERFPGARLDAFEAWDVLEDPSLASVGCPTLVIHGGAEPLGVAHAERAAARIPDAELRVIPQGSHHALWVSDDAAAQQAFALDWVRSHPSG
ncbi:alpha/beta fold hydrolase [Demequina lignilytica]|uniref:Alpha/beta hydrolase n=1 Tax=Demequina lignilytica TaxID=3051663 RepID=A0AB35MKS1_9MICO|nr:alpha/beta hydrolase [Demequina sp. SYSU T0a273]MDN4484373.1 alpha/beta hydrolase [Demequina sp. SYSU T0a273]